MTEKKKSQWRPRHTDNLKGRTVLSAVADGDLSPSQMAALLGAISTLARLTEIDELVARIATLEAMSALVDDMTIIRRSVSRRHIDAEILRLRDDDGRAWIRQLDEAKQALIDRASLEVKHTQ